MQVAATVPPVVTKVALLPLPTGLEGEPPEGSGVGGVTVGLLLPVGPCDDGSVAETPMGGNGVDVEGPGFGPTSVGSVGVGRGEGGPDCMPGAVVAPLLGGSSALMLSADSRLG